MVLWAVLLLGADALATVLAGLGSYLVFGTSSVSGTPQASVSLVLGLITLSVVVSFWERGLYGRTALFSRDLWLRHVTLAWLQGLGISLVFLLAAVGVSGTVWDWQALAGIAPALRGSWLPVFLVTGLAALLGIRAARRSVFVSSAPPNRTVIIGTTSICADFLTRVRHHPPQPLNLLGVIEHDRNESAGHGEAQATATTFQDLPILGGPDTLKAMIEREEVDTVLIALPWSDAALTRTVVARIAMLPIDVYVVPGLEGLPFADRPVSRCAGVPLLMASHRPLDGWQTLVKRAEDLIIGGLLLALVAPAMIAIAIAIKLTSRGTIFFRQRRLGFNNQVIEVLKFRTMYAHMCDAGAAQQTMRDDARITSIGGFLRRTSLDELPQLLNVLRGDMSLVGPRPHALQTTAGGLPLDVAVPSYASRHRVKPGITGWAQVNGYRGALDSVDKIVHRVNHDLYYIENWSLAFDIKILLRTVALVVVDDNAF